jgi:hypothetical protein
MARIERVILVCDACGADDGDSNGAVVAHRITVDGAGWTVDACERCWGTTYRETLEPVTRHAARVRIPRGKPAGKPARASSKGSRGRRRLTVA